MPGRQSKHRRGLGRRRKARRSTARTPTRLSLLAALRSRKVDMPAATAAACKEACAAPPPGDPRVTICKIQTCVFHS